MHTLRQKVPDPLRAISIRRGTLYFLALLATSVQPFNNRPEYMQPTGRPMPFSNPVLALVPIPCH